MSKLSFREYWNKQRTSRHRSDTPLWFQKKAEEHAALMNNHERSNGVIDLGCGAGELLKPLSDKVKINAGVDYSKNMLNEARELNKGKPIDFLEDDIFKLLPARSDATWITTGALNQYLNADELHRLFEIFSSNNSAHSFLLFDTVDPIRYRLLLSGIRYTDTHQNRHDSTKEKIVSSIKNTYIKTRALLAIVSGMLKPSRHSIKLGRVGMGYGYQPKFWHALAQKHHLDIEIVSSRYYEYRYHVLLRKGSTFG